MNQRNHLVVAKKFSRGLKRGSASNLHHLASLQQSSSRDRLSDRGSIESKKQKKKTYKRSRFNWIKILRQQIIRKNTGKLYIDFTSKDAIATIQAAKWIYSQNQLNIEEQIQAQDIIKLFKKNSKSKISIDDLITIISPPFQQTRITNTIRQKHHSCSQIIPPVQNDPQTARFNDSYSPSIHLFTSSQHTLESQSKIKDQQSEYLTLFDQMFKQSCENIKNLGKKHNLTTVQKNILNQFLDYNQYSRNGEIFCGIKLTQLQNNSQLNKLLQTSEIKQFLSYIQALRISRSQLTCFDSLIRNSLKIVNLSDNNLSNINFLSKCQELQFLNVNHNQLKTLNPIKDHKRLTQIHCLNNFIQVPLSSHKLQKLQLLDLGYNQIIDPKVIVLFNMSNNLRILNLIGNPIFEVKSNCKKQLTNMFSNIRNFQYPEVYVLSEYSIYKDVCFFMDQQKKMKQNMVINKN